MSVSAARGRLNWAVSLSIVEQGSPTPPWSNRIVGEGGKQGGVVLTDIAFLDLNVLLTDFGDHVGMCGVRLSIVGGDAMGIKLTWRCVCSRNCLESCLPSSEAGTSDDQFKGRRIDIHPA